MDGKELKQEFQYLKKYNIHLIAISNSEWYTLFKDEIRNSIAIEGIFANRNELLDVLEKNRKSNDQKTSAILGYFESASSVYEYANNLYEQNEFSIRLSDIRQIHTLLMRYEKQVGSFTGKLGDYRNEIVEVTQSRFSSLNYMFIRETMDIYVKWLNKKLDDKKNDPIKLAALSHILFETIHPFRDGNGRTGRILLSFILIGSGYTNIAIKGTQKVDRDNYYEAMERGDNEFEKMLRLIEKGEKLAVKDIDEFASRTDSSLLEKIILERLNHSFTRLKEKPVIQQNLEAVIPLRDAAKFYNYSQDYLRNLINKQKLPALKKGKLWFIRIKDIEKYIASFDKKS
jgi:Fic family protein